MSSNGELYFDGEQIGPLVFDDNYIEKIEIDHEYQGHGYGTEAIELYLDRMVELGYERVTTTPATAPEIIHIFKEKLGIHRVQDPSKHDFLPDESDQRYPACYFKDPPNESV